MATLAPAYAARRPTETALYGIVRDNLETFLSWARETYAKPLPRYVEQELRAYLRCGVFAHGFVPVRQYVLSLPFALRALAAFKPEVLRAMARLFVEAIFALYRTRVRRGGLMGSECGAVTFVQRFGGSLNLNVHMHVVVLDGVFVRDADHGIVFHAAPPPTLVELEALVRRVRDRALVWLRRRGLLDERPLEERSNEAPEPAALDGCAAIAMYRGTLAMLPASEDQADGSSSDAVLAGAARSALAVERDGFNLHAGVRIEAGDDLGRERLCRYGARPPLSLERLRRLPGGRVAYRVKYVSRGRAKHRVMTSIELLARLSALLPPPRYPLTRYHGVLAPRSAWRREIVPRAPASSADVTAAAAANRCGSSAAGARDQGVGKRTEPPGQTSGGGRDGHQSLCRPAPCDGSPLAGEPRRSAASAAVAIAPSPYIAPDRLPDVGSGQVGEVLAGGFLKHGHEVMRGSRDSAKLGAWKEKAGPKASVGTFAETAKFGDLLVLAVKGTAAESALDQAGAGNLEGKVILDATNPIADEPPQNGVLRYFTGPNDSLMERLQTRFPKAKLVKCFSSVGSARFVNPDFGSTRPTMFICGNDKGAKEQATTILDTFGWDTEDMGGVESARAIEPLCMLWCIPGFTQNRWTHAFKLLK